MYSVKNLKFCISWVHSVTKERKIHLKDISNQKFSELDILLVIKGKTY